MAIRYLSGINVDSNTLFVDDANNLVGIGTGSPAGSLHIQKNSGNYSNEAVKITGTPLSNVTDGTSATEGYGLYLSYNISGNRQFVFADTVSGFGVRYIGTSLDGFNKITQTRQDLTLGTETNGVHVAVGISNTQFSVSNVNGTASKIVTEIKGAASQSANYLNISSSGGQGDIVSVFSSGNVGIGTATDTTYKLNVVGTIRATGTLYSDNGSSAGALNLGQVVGIGSSFGSFANLVFNMHNGGGYSDIMKLQGNGNVGIGTNSPGTNLEVTTASSSTTVYPLSLTNSVNEPGTVGGAGIRFSTSSGPGGAGNEANKYSSIEAFDVNNYGSNSGLSFTTSLGYTKTKSMVIDRNGNVGIGTTSPGGRLSVIGTISQNATLQSGNTWANLILDSSASANADTNFVYANAGALVWDVYNDGPTNDLRINTKTVSGAGVVAQFKQNGNVQIGTITDSGYKLDVIGGGRYYSSVNGNFVSLTLSNINAGSSARNTLQFTNDAGNVGSIDVFGSNWAATGGGDDIADGFRILAPSSGGLSLRASTSTIRFYTGSTERMHITAAGNVGIGTTAPTQKLQVNGVIESGPTSVAGGPMIYQSYGSPNYIGSIGSEYANGAMLIGYGATGKNGASGYVSTFANFNGIRGLIKLHSGEFSVLSSISAVQTAVGGDLTMTTNFIVTNAGNVGIGTTSPGQALTLGANKNIRLDWGGGTDTTLEMYYDADYRQGIKFQGNDRRLTIYNYRGDGNDTDLVLVNGNVLIGTTTDAGYKLDVNGTSRSAGITLSGFATGTAGGNLELGFDGTHGVVQGYNRTSSTWLPLFLSGSDFRFSPSGTEFVRITSTGIGIGTTNPSGRLHVAGGDIVLNNTYSLYLNSSISDGNWRVQKSSAPNITRSLVSGASLNLYSHFGTGEGFVIGANGGNSYYEILGSGPTHFFRGNVLIGTSTDAGYKLDVNGTGRFSGSITSNASGVGTLLLGSASGSSQIAGRITATESPSYSATGKIGFSVTTWGVGTDYGLTEVMAIDMRGADSKAPTIWMNPFGGNVGIGTTSPLAKLDIQDSSTNIGLRLGNTNGTNWDFYSYNDSNLYINNAVGTKVTILNANGNVGIGTTAPGYKLQVNGDAAFFSAAGSLNSIITQGSEGKGRFYLYDGGNATIALQTNGLSYFNAGNVLIGTTTDNGAKLQVAGSVTASANISLGNTSINPVITFTGAPVAGFTSGYISWGGTGVNTTPMLTISTPGSNLEIITGYNERMVVSSGAGIAIFTNDGIGNYTNRFQLNRNGSINAGAYGSGSITGTPAYNLAVDASGNIIELPGGVVDGSGTANQLARWQDANTLTNAGIEDNGSAISIGRDAFYSSTNYGIAYAAVTGTSGGTAWFDTVTVSGVRLYNITIFANPNVNGSGSYRDFYYGKIIIGTGYNGSAVVDFINYHQESPQPRSLYGSGGGNLTVTAVFVYGGSEVTEVPTGATYTIRIKIAGYNGAGAGTQINLQRIM